MFGKEIKKGKRLFGLIFGFSKKVNSEQFALNSLLNFTNFAVSTKCPLERIFKILKKNREITKRNLQKTAKVSHVTLHKYLWILRKENIVAYYKANFDRNFEKIYKFNENLNEWRVPTY